MRCINGEAVFFLSYFAFSRMECHILTPSRVPLVPTPFSVTFIFSPFLSSSRFSLYFTPVAPFLKLPPTQSSSLLHYPQFWFSDASHRRKTNMFSVCRKMCGLWMSYDGRQLCWKRLSTSVPCTDIYKCVEDCQVCVLLEVYANEGRYVNECPNLDVNYSAWLIIICLMRRKVEERSGMEGLP